MQRYLVLVLFSFLFGCNEKKDSYSWSLVHADSVNSKFLRAEELMRQGQFFQAKTEYSLLCDQKLKPSEKEYASLAESLAFLLASDSAILKKVLSPPHEEDLSALFHLVSGINLLHQSGSGYEHLNRAKQEMKKRGKQSLPYLIVLNQLGLYYLSSEYRLDSSSYYFKEALQLTGAEKKLAGFQPELLYKLAELSLMFRDTYTALTYVQQALSQPLPEEVRGKMLTIKGVMFRKLSQHDSAAKYYEKARLVLSGSGMEAGRAILLREMALTDILQKDNDGFNRCIIELKQIDSVSRGPQVNIDRLLGYYYFTFNQPERSVRHYEAAVKVLRKQKPVDVVQLGEAYYVLTEQYRALKKFREAEFNCFQGMIYATPEKKLPFEWQNIIRPSVMNRPNNFVGFALLVDLYLDHFEADHDQGHLIKALKLCQLTDSVMASQIQAREEEALMRYGMYGHRTYSGGIRACFQLYQKTNDTSLLNRAHNFFEKSRDIMVYRDKLIRQDEYFKEVPEDFKNREFEIKENIRRLKHRGEGLSTMELTKSINELEFFYREMKNRYPDYYRSRFQIAVRSFRYFQKLSSSTHRSFVQYHTTDRYVYFLTYDEAPQFGRIPIDSLFEKKFTSLINSINKPPRGDERANPKDLLGQLNYFYKKIVKPVRVRQPNLLVVVDGAFSRLPFEILVKDSTSKDFTKCLLSELTISYAHSLKEFDLKIAGSETISLKKILAYAYSSGDRERSKNGLAELPGSFRELQLVKAIFPESEVKQKSGTGATRDQFLSDISEPFNVLHLATHANTSFSNKFDNKILFKSAGTKPDVVYGFELATHKLAADLVVLTGCETSSGPWVVGEGAFSLARAFQQTGAKNIVASLWSIPDQTSAEIVKVFYEDLKQGKPIDSSLREAKLKYLAAADRLTSHPYFWASLISF